jgi:hypothetical protein
MQNNAAHLLLELLTFGGLGTPLLSYLLCMGVHCAWECIVHGQRTRSTALIMAMIIMAHHDDGPCGSFRHQYTNAPSTNAMHQRQHHATSDER